MNESGRARMGFQIALTAARIHPAGITAAHARHVQYLDHRSGDFVVGEYPLHRRSTKNFGRANRSVDW
jgi:hypothetical protein